MKNIKPFSLPEALAGKAVMLRDGSKAYVRHYETELPVAGDRRLIGFLADGKLLTWYEGGNYNRAGHKSFHDIIGMYPETRVINGFEVPAPEAEAPVEGTAYYMPMLHAENPYSCEYWDDHDMDKLWLERGLIFLCKEHAIANALAMMGTDPRTKEKKNETI